MPKAAKRIGRPPKKPPQRGKKVSLGLKVTPDIKRHLDSARKTTGRTQSQEAEYRIEASYAYENALGDLEEARHRLAAVGRMETERVLDKLGWGSIIDIHYGGKVWLPPGRHRIPKSSWVDPNNPMPPLPAQIIPDPKFVEFVQAIVDLVRAELGKEGGK